MDRDAQFCHLINWKLSVKGRLSAITDLWTRFPDHHCCQVIMVLASVYELKSVVEACQYSYGCVVARSVSGIAPLRQAVGAASSVIVIVVVERPYIK